MRLLMRAILAVWFVITMTLAQGCLATSPGANPYTSGATPLNPTGNGASGGSRSGTSVASATSHLDTSGYTASQPESEALTDYLKQHRLPLVGAQVLHGPDAQRAVVLYGYVGSEFGKGDATAKTGEYMNDPGVVIDNRIKVRPEILAGPGSKPGSDATSGSSATEANASNADNSSYPDADSYVAQQQAAEQYAQQQPGGIAISGGFVPLAFLGLMALGMAVGGSNFSIGAGSSGPPGGLFGPSAPYNPYPGYPSPPPYPPYGP